MPKRLLSVWAWYGCTLECNPAICVIAAVSARAALKAAQPCGIIAGPISADTLLEEDSRLEEIKALALAKPHTLFYRSLDKEREAYRERPNP